LSESIAAGDRVDVATLREAFLNTEDFPQRLARLMELEEQALALLEDEPLKLGAMGSAILDVFQGSLTGHYAMLRFYDHVSSDDAAENHRAWLDAIRSAIEAGEGSVDAPFEVMTRTEGRTHVLLDALEPVGGIYQSTDAHPFMLLLVTKPEDEALSRRFYDVSPMYLALQQDSSAQDAAADTTPFTLIGLLARESDSAAQAAVGAFLASRNRTEDAIGWLRASSRAGNVLANTLLARIFFDASRSEEDESKRTALLSDALDNYVHAIALGSSDAMYALAVLYLGGHYGEENLDAGIPLLERAARLDHSDAILYLAHLHAAGERVVQSNELAANHYVRAAELDNRRALGAYARFLVADQTIAADPRVLGWLQQYADQEDAEAMLLIGNLHARGIIGAQDIRAALRSYRRAVKANPRDANIVNEVAWTLVVSDIQALQEPRYAKRIMDDVMTEDADARGRPEYLDTWAAVHAANGDFDRAVELQEQALARARELNRTDVLEVLETHLEKFRAGETIIEPAP
jgi:TPR repeat protein